MFIYEFCIDINLVWYYNNIFVLFIAYHTRLETSRGLCLFDLVE